MTILAHAIDLLFPPQCLNCHVLVPAEGTLCLPCWQTLRFITEPQCHCCGLPFEYDIGKEALCGECMRESPPYASARAVFLYDEASRSMVLKFKYQDQVQLAPAYGAWLAKAGRGLIEKTDLIAPVPLYYWRFVRRRYNQAALLAQALAKHCKLPVIPDALVRTRATESQTGLTRSQREDNMRGAFAAHPKWKDSLKDKSILLIDDVMTTGTTLESCAKTLLKAGAKEVRALTLARTA